MNKTKLILYIALVFAVLMLLYSYIDHDDTEDTTDVSVQNPTPSEYGVVGIDEAELISGINCDNALLTRVTGLDAVATRNSSKMMYPASMTKVMTFVVAFENAESLTDKMTITKEMKNKYADASRVGIDVGDILNIEQLLYALLLESDTDAALALAEYVAGGEEEFVRLMNAKCDELGLVNTNFTNVTGLHDDNHYTTAMEMTSIFAYALENELFKTIITTDTYVTYLEYYDEGVLREYRMTFQNTTTSPIKGRFAKNGVSLEFGDGGAIIGGKTGYTDEAEYCLALLVKDGEGEEYILITASAKNQKDSARDSLHICENYLN